MLSFHFYMRAVSTNAAPRITRLCTGASGTGRMGVDNIITFDAHDPRVQNAIPLSGFETVSPAYQFTSGILKRTYKDLQIDATT